MFLNWRVNEQPVLYTYIGIITWYRPVSSVSLLYFCMETPVISFVLSTWIQKKYKWYTSYTLTEHFQRILSEDETTFHRNEFLLRS